MIDISPCGRYFKTGKNAVDLDGVAEIHTIPKSEGTFGSAGGVTIKPEDRKHGWFVEMLPEDTTALLDAWWKYRTSPKAS